jgi:hypothetical protein
MAQNDGLKNLKFVLAVFAFFYLLYGVGFLFFPGMLVVMSGSPEPFSLSWIRWTGGPLIALGIGAIQVFRKPARQRVFVTISTVTALLIGLGLLYSKIFDHSTSSTWFHMFPCLVNLALFGLLLWARQGAKEILE